MWDLRFPGPRSLACDPIAMGCMSLVKLSSRMVSVVRSGVGLPAQEIHPCPVFRLWGLVENSDISRGLDGQRGDHLQMP